MNAIIHFFAAVASIVFVILILRLQNRYAFVLELLKNQSRQLGPERIRLVDPIKFLAEFASVLGVPLENSSGLSLPICRVNSRIWTETFLRYGIRLVRCEMSPGGPTVEVRLSSPEATVRELEGALANSLGDKLRVIVRIPEPNGA